MDYWDRKLMRELLDKKLPLLHQASYSLPFKGKWLKAIRQALGMTTAQLARKAGMSQARVSQIEGKEAEGELKISTLEKMGEALDMTFIYGFVSNESLESMVEAQARKLALARLKDLSHTMSLEMQQLSASETDKALKDMIQKILIESPKDLWDL